MAQGSEVVCISSEEDLQRMVELGSWYDSEEESSSETEDTDFWSDQGHNEVKLTVNCGSLTCMNIDRATGQCNNLYG